MTQQANTTEDRTNDPRQGFTSASNAEADLLCPGRHLAQRGLVGYASRDAASGTLVHAAFAGLIGDSEISMAQRKTVQRGREIEQYVVRNWFNGVGLPLEDPETEIQKRAHRELRLWAYRNNQKIHSGGIDALWLAGDMKFALVEDLKSLFGDIDDASSNQQLRDYAALVALNYGCEQVAVFINQPNVRWALEEQKLVIYQAEHLAEAVRQMSERVMQSQRLDAKRFPGQKQCNFCLACGTDRCPESLAYISKSFNDLQSESWQYWEPSERSKFLDITKAAEKLVENALKVAKEKIKADSTWAPGWTVTPDVPVRSVEDVSAVADALVEMYASGDAEQARAITASLAAICKVSVGDLEKMHAELSDAGTTADRQAEFKVLFGHLIKISTRAGSLKKAK